MNGLMTSAAVLLEDRTSRAYPLGDLVRLILLGPLDLVLYRPFIVWARLQGHVAVPARRPRLAQVRAQRASSFGVTRSGRRRVHERVGAFSILHSSRRAFAVVCAFFLFAVG